MQSRLAQLKKARGDPEKVDVEKGRGDDTDSDSDSDGKQQASDSSEVELDEVDEELKDFFADVGKIKRELTKIKGNLRTLKDLYDGQLNKPVSLDSPKEADTSKDLGKLVDETNFAAQSVTNMLKRMDAENKKIPAEEKGFASGRIRINMHGTLSKQFVDVMKQYQGIQTDYKNIHRDNFERRYRMVKTDATDAEIEEALESGTGADVIAEQILNTRHAKAKEALQYVENKHRDIVRLEASIKELHQLFVDMAVLVEAQGEMIDHIESNLESARDYTRKGVKELHQANVNQKKSRKSLCILIGVILCAIVIAVVLGGGFGGSWF